MSVTDFSGKRVGPRFLLSSLLGYGSAGGVYQAVDTTSEDSHVYAIKCVRESNNSQRRRQQIAEIANHAAVAELPHIMMLYDVFEEHGCFFLVFQLCEKDMFRAIWKDKVYRRNDVLIKEVFIEILDGVFACHSKGVFHRDLKPENIMCNKDGRDIKIGDFGLSSNRRPCRDGRCGTTNYMSPECLNENERFYYGGPADIWALGVILFNMVTCCYPWEEASPANKEYMEFVTEKDHLYRTSPISEALSTLLKQIWHPTPLRRLSIPAIREMILLMDTFYKPRHSSRAVLQLSKEVFSPGVDSQQTCVAPGEGAEKDSSDDTLEEIRLSLLHLGSIRKRRRETNKIL